MAKTKVEEQQDEAAPERISRWEAACRVVKNWQDAAEPGAETTLKEMVREVEKAVVAGGMKPNADASEAEIWSLITPLDGLAQIEIVYTIRKK